ncbi:MAG: hypothetical protein HRT40_12220 [Campylobacteraceae bacterium]|nr:hypothetical protein [Campylobacteraceae bacterium]
MNYNEILLLGAKILDINLNKFNLMGDTQQKRFTAGVNIKKDTSEELSKALEKQLVRDIGSRRTVKTIKHIIEMYLIICESIKIDINIKTDEQIKKIDLIILKRFIVPYAAICLADLDSSYNNRADKGFSGGRFWYLPDLTVKKKVLDLPVKYVLNYWIDLYGKGRKGMEDDINIGLYEEGKSSTDILSSWLKNKRLPKRSTVSNYISKLDNYKGIFINNTNKSIDDQYDAALNFVNNIKKISQENLFHEIAGNTLKDKIYGNGTLNTEDKERFVGYIVDRWSNPNQEILKSRFMVARAMQDIWNKINLYVRKDSKIIPENDIETNLALQMNYMYQIIHMMEMINRKDGITPYPLARHVILEYIFPLDIFFNERLKGNSKFDMSHLLSDIKREFNFIEKHNQSYMELHLIKTYYFSENGFGNIDNNYRVKSSKYFSDFYNDEELMDKERKLPFKKLKDFAYKEVGGLFKFF